MRKSRPKDVIHSKWHNYLELELEFKHLIPNPSYFSPYIIANFSSHENACREYGLWKNQTNPDLTLCRLDSVTFSFRVLDPSFIKWRWWYVTFLFAVSVEWNDVCKVLIIASGTQEEFNKCFLLSFPPSSSCLRYKNNFYLVFSVPALLNSNHHVSYWSSKWFDYTFAHIWGHT